MTIKYYPPRYVERNLRCGVHIFFIAALRAVADRQFAPPRVETRSIDCRAHDTPPLAARAFVVLNPFLFSPLITPLITPWIHYSPGLQHIFYFAVFALPHRLGRNIIDVIFVFFLRFHRKRAGTFNTSHQPVHKSEDSFWPRRVNSFTVAKRLNNTRQREGERESLSHEIKITIPQN